MTCPACQNDPTATTGAHCKACRFEAARLDAIPHGTMNQYPNVTDLRLELRAISRGATIVATPRAPHVRAQLEEWVLDLEPPP